MNFLIQPITEKYLNEALKLHIDVFFNNEPLTPRLNILKNEFKKIIDKQLLSSIRNEYSIGAFNNNELITFIICSDMNDLSKDQTLSLNFKNPFKKLHLAIEKLNIVLKQEPFITKRLFHIETMGVDKSYVGYGMGKELIKKALQIAQDNNFDYIYAECTNIFSENGMLNNGFEIAHQYEWKDCGIKEFENLAGNFSLTVKNIF